MWGRVLCSFPALTSMYTILNYSDADEEFLIFAWYFWVWWVWYLRWRYSKTNALLKSGKDHAIV